MSNANVRKLCGGVVALVLGLCVSGPTTAKAQGVFEAGIGAEIPSGTYGDFMSTGVYFEILFGYKFKERFVVNGQGTLSLLGGQTVTVPGATLPIQMFDIDQWRFGVGLDANVLNPRSKVELLAQGFIGFATLSIPGTGGVVCNPFCWVVPGVSQTNFSTGVGGQLNYKVNPRVAVGAGAKYTWIFDVDVFVAGVSESRTLATIPVSAYVRFYQ